jgi:hypothetical protein
MKAKKGVRALENSAAGKQAKTRRDIYSKQTKIGAMEYCLGFQIKGAIMYQRVFFRFPAISPEWVAGSFHYKPASYIEAASKEDHEKMCGICGFPVHTKPIRIRIPDNSPIATGFWGALFSELMGLFTDFAKIFTRGEIEIHGEDNERFIKHRLSVSGKQTVTCTEFQSSLRLLVRKVPFPSPYSTPGEMYSKGAENRTIRLPCSASFRKYVSDIQKV